jgi:hypothetical protein
MILRVVMMTAVFLSAGSAQAASKKETDCGHQASVVGAIQQARIARTSESKVSDFVLEDAIWPEKYNGAIPIMTPWVYEMKMRDVKSQDLSAAWKELCLQQ